MKDTDLREVVRSVVARHSRIHVDPIEPTHRLAADLGFDSLAFLLALSDLEDRIAFRFPDGEDDSLRDISVGELERLVLQSDAAGRP